ncbi:MAG: putative sulfate exporter family transporter [Acetobacteraceae bacterium]|nr:putative sulfate exporter family transporter [Acetobacteraceae bacterium]
MTATTTTARRAGIGQLAPGVIVCFIIAYVAVLIRNATGASALNPVVVALAVGIAIHAAVGLPPVLRPGAAFTVRPVLRAAVVLLGLQVTPGQLLHLGAGALGLAVAAVALTIPFTISLGSRLGVSRELSQLIGAGTGICGASAIVAANQVVRGRQEDVAYALAVVTLFGTASLLAYPALEAILHLDPRTFGLWAGASIHEVVQAVGAAAAGGSLATEAGTITKLARVVLLAPAILGLGWWVRQSGNAQTGELKAPVPWFAFGFLLLVALGGTGLVPPEAVRWSTVLVPIMMGAAVAALGLNTDLRALRKRGGRPLLLGLGSTLFIAALGLVGALLAG